MITVTVDPGTTTGVAHFRGSKLVQSFDAHQPHYSTLTTLLNVLTSRSEQVDLIVEVPPAHGGHQMAACERVIDLVREHAGDLAIIELRPSEWKGHPQAYALPSDEKPGMSQHQRDAIRMGRRHIAIREQHASASH